MIQVDQATIDEYVSKGWWGHQTLGEIFLDTAARQPDTFAVADTPNRAELFGGAFKRWSWSELREETGRMTALIEQQGVRKDDVIVVQLPNCVELHALYLACAINGI